MRQPWEPEHAVDGELAVRLVAAVWPDLDAAPPRFVGSGWDVDVWRFGELAVRFPRRAAGARCLDNELRVLPSLVDHLPLPAPRPLRVAGPVEAYPARFYAHAWLPGVPASRADLDDAGLWRLAVPLGRFLRALHAAPRPAELADDARGDIAAIAARAEVRLPAVDDEALRDAAAAILAVPPPMDFASVVIHGDLHAGNVLVDDAAPPAVIDWGDCAAGDPAIDLAIGWSALPAAARGTFLAAYGDVTAATWARARVNAVARHGLALLAWGRDQGDDETIAFATASLRRCLG